MSASDKDGACAAAIDGFRGQYGRTPQPQFLKVPFLQGQTAEDVLLPYQNG